MGAYKYYLWLGMKTLKFYRMKNNKKVAEMEEGGGAKIEIKNYYKWKFENSKKLQGGNNDHPYNIHTHEKRVYLLKKYVYI